MDLAQTLNQKATRRPAADGGRADASPLASGIDLVGRVLIAALFLPAGISKLTGFEGTVGYISSAGVPLPALAAALAAAVEIIGGAAVLLGYRTRIAAAALALFTVAASVLFHAYWAAPADQAMVQSLLFFKNLAIVGGLMVLAANSTGRWRLDSRF